MYVQHKRGVIYDKVGATEEPPFHTSITESPEFKFDMTRISKFRWDMELLIMRLADLYRHSLSDVKE